MQETQGIARRSRRDRSRKVQAQSTLPTLNLTGFKPDQHQQIVAALKTALKDENRGKTRTTDRRQEARGAIKGAIYIQSKQQGCAVTAINHEVATSMVGRELQVQMVQSTELIFAVNTLLELNVPERHIDDRVLATFLPTYTATPATQNDGIVDDPLDIITAREFVIDERTKTRRIQRSVFSPLASGILAYIQQHLLDIFGTADRMPTKQRVLDAMVSVNKKTEVLGKDGIAALGITGFVIWPKAKTVQTGPGLTGFRSAAWQQTQHDTGLPSNTRLTGRDTPAYTR